MPAIKNILCPIDFSRCSADALTYAVDLAQKLSADLQLVHVYQDPLADIPFARSGTAGPATAPTPVVEEARRQRLAEAEKLRAMCAEQGVTTRVEEVDGVPAQTIVQVAEARGCDLIVMGTHGRTGVAHAMVGSVAERVVRLAPCPVLTVRSKQ